MDRVPASPSQPIGRERELAELQTRLREGARLLTLTGPGGSGKTRLALELAERSADDFAGGTFVDLSGVRDPSLVPRTIATALAASHGTVASPFEAIVRHIGEDRVLLLLDNFEQLLPESAIVSDLLSACPALVVIATSRAPLELRWEHVYPVGPLEVPDSAAPLPLAALRRVAAVALFCERARAIRPLFTLDGSTAPSVTTIVRTLDGMPLAIELAAARLRVLSVSEIAARVERALDLLTQGEQDRPARQRTIRATIDWSLDLLTERQRRLLRRLAVFSGGAPLDAVEAIAGEPDGGGTLDDLEGLVQAGVAIATEARGETRVRLPATVRERATELLETSGEREAIADRHSRWFAAFVTRGVEGQSSADEGLWYARFETEADNIRAALQHSLRPPPADREPGMAIVADMLGAWYAQGAHEEALRWIDLALSDGPASPHRIQILCNGGWFSHQAGDLRKAERYYRAVLELAERDGVRHKVVDANAELGRIARDRGDEAAARAHYDEALRLLDELDVPEGGRCAYEWAAGEARRWYGHPDAKALIERALAHARRGALPQPTVACLTSLADLARERGDRVEARALLDEAWALARSVGHRLWLRNVLTSRIVLACADGEPARAAELCWKSVRLAREAADRTALSARWIDALAYSAVVLGQHDAAARLFGHADALRAEIGAALPPVERPLRERALAAIGAVLGTRAGATADPSIASLFALAERLFAPPQPSAIVLSRREREVASLVVRGMSNRAIAERLVLGERTVETHVTRVLRKLDVTSRHGIAARAEELALTL